MWACIEATLGVVRTAAPSVFKTLASATDGGSLVGFLLYFNEHVANVCDGQDLLVGDLWRDFDDKQWVELVEVTFGVGLVLTVDVVYVHPLQRELKFDILWLSGYWQISYNVATTSFLLPVHCVVFKLPTF